MNNVRTSDDELTDAVVNQDDAVAEVLPRAIAVFRGLNNGDRRRLFATLSTLFDISQPVRNGTAIALSTPSAPTSRFSVERDIGPKEFLFKKSPRTDVERIACLAYFLTNYRDQKYFKTLDLSKLNTEAAQTKLANAAKAVSNATQYGYLAVATKGNKQISALGEMYVEALPDRHAAVAVMAGARPKRSGRKPSRRSGRA